MTELSVKAQSEPTPDILERLAEEKQRCYEANCANIGRRGCVLMNELLPLPVRITQAAPCNRAVAQIPGRQRKPLSSAAYQLSKIS